MPAQPIIHGAEHRVGCDAARAHQAVDLDVSEPHRELDFRDHVLEHRLHETVAGAGFLGVGQRSVGKVSRHVRAHLRDKRAKRVRQHVFAAGNVEQRLFDVEVDRLAPFTAVLLQKRCELLADHIPAKPELAAALVERVARGDVDRVDEDLVVHQAAAQHAHRVAAAGHEAEERELRFVAVGREPRRQQVAQHVVDAHERHVPRDTEPLRQLVAPDERAHHAGATGRAHEIGPVGACPVVSREQLAREHRHLRPVVHCRVRGDHSAGVRRVQGVLALLDDTGRLRRIEPVEQRHTRVVARRLDRQHAVRPRLAPAARHCPQF
ncbi:hypothetical protein KL943_003224 [Ogataea angusta]|nr:hypothetical protein KL943_003224 [Ogataea angusta]